MTGTPSDRLAGAEVAPDVLDTPDAGGRAIRGSAVRGASYVAGLLVTLGTVPLMVRHLGVVDTGRFVTVTSILFIVAGATEAGLGNVAVREYTTVSPAGRRRLISNIVGLRVALTAAGVAVGCAFTIVAGYQPVVIFGTAISGAGLILTVMQQTYAVPLAATLRWGRSSLLDFLNQALAAILVVVLVVAGARLGPFFFVTGASSLGALLATLVVLRSELSWRPTFDLSAWRRLMRDVLPYALAATVGILYFRVAMIALSLISTGAQTGYYGVALRVVEIVGGLNGLLVSSVFPILTRAARDDQARLRYALGGVFDIAVILGSLFAFCLAVGAPTVVAVVAGGKFGPAVPVLRIQALALAPGFLATTGSFALLSLRRHSDVLKANGVALAGAIAGTALLVPPMGAKGAAIATTAAEVILAASYWTLLLRARPDLRPGMRTVPIVALACLVGVIPVVALSLPNVVAAVIGAALFGTIVMALRGLPPEIQHALLTPLRGRTAT